MSFEITYEQMAAYLQSLPPERLDRDERMMLREVTDVFERNVVPKLSSLQKVSALYDRETRNDPCIYLTTAMYTDRPMCKLKLEGRIEARDKGCSFVENPKSCPEYRWKELS